MKITPLDIQQKQFPLKFRGFDVEEVDSFLETVREEFEYLIRENNTLREEVERLKQRLEEYKESEESLKKTLVTTQQMVQEFRESAKKEAEILIKDAEMKAEKMLERAQTKAIKIHEDITDLKGIRKHFREEMKRLLDRFSAMLKYDEEEDEEEEKTEELTKE
ncbi:MAG: DivIVA domain-containing protein [Nitrospirota bacterium]